MTTDSTAPPPSSSRRRFLGLGALAAAGAGLGVPGARKPSQGSAALVRWADTARVPDAPARLVVSLPEAPAGPVTARLVVSTPTETMNIPLGEHTLPAGETTLATQLVYPYEDFVVGDYSYHVELEVDGTLVTTAAPVTYRVAPIAWFS